MLVLATLGEGLCWRHGPPRELGAQQREPKGALNQVCEEAWRVTPWLHQAKRSSRLPCKALQGRNWRRVG